MGRCPTTDSQEQLVRNLYAKEGNGPNYNREFDKLHDMRMHTMAAKYRKARGLHPKAKTPYC